MASFWEMSPGSTLRPETWGQTEGQYTEKPKSIEKPRTIGNDAVLQEVSSMCVSNFWPLLVS